MAQAKPLPVLLIEQGREMVGRNALAEAETLFRHAVDVAAASKAPEPARSEYRAMALFNLGRALEKQEKLPEAIESLHEALSVKPHGANHGEFARIVYNNLGNLSKTLNRLEDACGYFERSLQIKPVVTVLVKLGNTLKKAGRREEAIAAYDRALEMDPSFHLARFGRCIAHLPIIYQDSEEILASRNRYRAALQMLCDHYAGATSKERAEAAEVVGLLQPFYIGYQGQNDRDPQQIYGGLVSRLMAERFPQWSRPVEPRPANPGEKLRIGIVSRFLLCRHSVWKIPLKGWVENLDRSKFDLYGYQTHPEPEYGQDASRDVFAKFVEGRRTVEGWANQIWADRLDAVIYPEISMDPFSLPLGCLRLAPLQMTGLGHPITSGLPTIDYYVSGDLLEPENGQEHYTEKLLILPNLSFCYTPLNLDAEAVDKARLSVADDEILFWCPQSLFKFLPEHDDVFPRIAKELGRCRFLFNPRTRDRISETFADRLRRAFAAYGFDAEKHCMMRYGISQREYNGINAAADVFLDSIGWSGGNTNIEALAYDLPIVTLPSALMRGRFAYGMYRLMGVEDTIAADKEDYVSLAIRLGRDGAFRRQMAEKIARTKHRLYGDLTPIRALEDFLVAQVERRRGTGQLACEKSPAAAAR